MKPAAGTCTMVLSVAVALGLCCGAGVGLAATTDQSAHTPDSSDVWIRFMPSYQYVQTSGFAGRVGEYDGLRQSGGGQLLLHWNEPQSLTRLDYRGALTSRDEYDMDGSLRIGSLFRLGVDARSLVHHLTKTPFGVNLSPDDILRTDELSDDALFGVKKTSLNANARLAIPHTPLAVFARGGLQDRHGLTQLKFYDMGGDPTCGSCHSASRYQATKYETQNITGGVELMASHTLVTYEHNVTIGRNRVENPVDLFGSTLSLPDDELPPGVPDTPAGNYVHNVTPGHRTDSDALRLHAPLPGDLELNGSVMGGRARNTYTSNHQAFVNGDATLAWRPPDLLDLTLDFHEQSLLNQFTPGYVLFGDPSLHRLWAAARAERRLTPLLDVEAHYRFTRVTRTNADLWPQIYSPDNADLLRVVPITTANATGVDVTMHRSSRWRVRGGYEWTITHFPGYLTDPRTAHRFSLNGSASPTRTVSLAETFNATFQSQFTGISRKNQLYLSTTSATLRPAPTWTIGLAYAIGAERLKTDLTYGTDPLYVESLVPYDATDQSAQVSSSWAVTKRLNWEMQLGYTWSLSEFKPLPDAAPIDPLPLYMPVGWASSFSRVDVPQVRAGTTLAYHWPMGYETSVRGAYLSYRDQVHPELTGYLRSISVFAGRSW